MKCLTCEINKICPDISPFGGYFCSNEHLQCIECNTSKKGHCGICHASTKFLQMSFSSPKSSVETALPCTPHSSKLSKDQLTCTTFSKKIIEEIETESRLSKEYLKIMDSKESIGQNTKEIDAIIGVGDVVIIKKDCEKEMETLFVGTMPASIIGNPDHQDVEYSKVENKKSLNFWPKELKDTNRGLDEDPKKPSVNPLDSTDCFQNSYAITETEGLARTSSDNYQQPSPLSEKDLRVFETQNSANRIEVVNSYLESCGPTTFFHSPAYNCQYSHCKFKCQSRMPTLERTIKTVSVSTDSDPSLKSICLDERLAAKLKPHDYLIMQAVGVSNPIDKDVKPSMDIRMQKILETFKEGSNNTKFSENSNLFKLPTQVPAKQQRDEAQNDTQNIKKEDNNSLLITKLLNTHRAFLNPSNTIIAPISNSHLLPLPQEVQQEPYLPQFQIVPCSKALAQELLLNQKQLLSLKPVPACMLNIPRSPIHCPESTCQRMIFVTDFNKHLVIDHSQLPMERISPYVCKNFFLDARLAHCGTSKCHLLYLMHDKITDLGSSEYKDFLPIMVMTTRISLNELCGLRDPASSMEFFLIWVTGIAPKEFPTSVSLTVWSRSGRVPSCHVVYSGKMYSIRKSQRAFDVWQSGCMLLLSAQEIDTLTCNGKEMLNLQLSVH